MIGCRGSTANSVSSFIDYRQSQDYHSKVPVPVHKVMDKRCVRMIAGRMDSSPPNDKIFFFALCWYFPMLAL